MSRKCTAIINLNAIKKNYLYAKSLAPESKAIAIVKADAYGHGAIEVAKHLNGSADYFGVACIEEAIELRDSGITKTPILLMEGVFELSEIKLIDKYNLTTTVCNSQQLQWLIDTKFDSPKDVFVKHDSGMGRLGFQSGVFVEAIELLEQSKNVNKITLMSHFSNANDLKDTSTLDQIKNFNSSLPTINYPISLANSAGLLEWNESFNNYIRPGIMLYGSSPFPDKSHLNKLIPAMSLSSALISIKSFKEGHSIGYGNRFTCEKDMKIGVVAIGYADGYPRSAKDGTPVYVNGIKTRVAGKVSMDMITIDLTDVPEPKIGDRVELFGDNISIDEVADYCNTISYEIFTQISKRVYKSFI